MLESNEDEEEKEEEGKWKYDMFLPKTFNSLRSLKIKKKKKKKKGREKFHVDCLLY